MTLGLENINTPKVELLNSTHRRDEFRCGAPELDRYFQRIAGQDTKSNVAAVHVLATGSKVHGFYTLSASSLTQDDIPEEMRRGLPKYAKLPVFLIGRLALDREFHGTGAGKFLLEDALNRCLAHNKEIKAIGVVVDAKNENAANFYKRHGFEPITEKKLYISTSELEKAYQLNIQRSLSKSVILPSQEALAGLRLENLARVASFTLGTAEANGINVNEMRFFTDLASLSKASVELLSKTTPHSATALNAFEIYEHAQKLEPIKLSDALKAMASLEKGISPLMDNQDQAADLQKAFKRIGHDFKAAREAHSKDITHENESSQEREL